MSERIQFTLNGAPVSVEAHRDDTLLDVLREQLGLVSPKDGCQPEGYCGCCMAQLKTGKVQMRTHDALTAKDLTNHWVLACQSRLEGDEPVEIDFDATY